MLNKVKEFIETRVKELETKRVWLNELIAKYDCDELKHEVDIVGAKIGVFCEMTDCVLALCSTAPELPTATELKKVATEWFDVDFDAPIEEPIVPQEITTLTTATKLEIAMKRLGLNQYEVADRLGVTQSIISKWLKGAVPYKRNALAIDNLYNEAKATPVNMARAR